MGSGFIEVKGQVLSSFRTITMVINCLQVSRRKPNCHGTLVSVG